MALYDIKQPDGTIVKQEPVVGAWYCHFEILDDTYHRDGQLAQYTEDGSFIDEDGEDVSMVSDYWSDYIVRQN